MTDSTRVIRAAELVATPWPNGRGVTRDIVRHLTPEGEIDWLVSIADLTEDAPFSRFPEIERVFTIVAGDPVELTIGDDPPMRCGLYVPLRFPGDRPTRMTMTGGASRALNVFTERRRRRARVSVQTLAAGQSDRTPASTRALHTLSDGIEAGGHLLGSGDTLLRNGVIAVQALTAPATVLVVEIDDLPDSSVG